MAERIRVPGLEHHEERALAELVGQWRAKLPRNRIRARSYEMKTATEPLMSSAAPDWVKSRSFVLGWSAIAVDKLNRRCNIDGFYEPGGADLGSLGLDELVAQNRLLSELSQAGAASLIHAVSFLAVTPGDVAAGEAPALLLPKDAMSATGMWDVRRKGLRSFLSIAETDDAGDPVAMTMWLPGVYLVLTKVLGRWHVDRRPHPHGLPVFAMRYKPRTGRVFGASRITRAVLSIHQQALGAMVRADVNGEAYSLPRYAFLGLDENSFEYPDGSPKPALKALWDAGWFLGDDEEMARDPETARLARADVKQFTGQSPEPQNAHLRMLAQMFSGETGIPIGELGIIGDSNPTSEGAQTVSRDDIVSEAERTTDEWSPDVADAVTAMLRMVHGDDVPRVLPRWRNPQHVSRTAAADAGLKTMAAFPWLAETEVGMEMAGMSRSQIERALAERRRASVRSMLAGLEAAAPSVAVDGRVVTRRAEA